MTIYTKLRDDLDRHLTAGKLAFQRADDENRDLTPAETAEVQRHSDAARDLIPQVRAAKADERVRKQLAALGPDVADGGSDRYGYSSGSSGGFSSHSASTGGSKAWSRTVADRLLKVARDTGLKALTTGSIDTPTIVEPGVVGIPQVPRRVLDLLVNRVSLASNTFEFLRQSARVNNAAAVADSGLKPTSVFTVSAVEDRCRVLAHLSEVFPVRFLTDYESLVSFLDSEMVEGVEQALETQALVGDGTGENLAGIFGTSGTVAVPYSTSLFATIRKARTAMELLGEVPTGWVMHPTDLETVDLQTDANGRLYLVGAGGDDRINALFGDLPRVASSRIPQGTAVLADWSQCRLYVREEVRLDMDRSGVLFDHNQVKLRAEARTGFAVLRPQAFALVDLAA